MRAAPCAQATAVPRWTSQGRVAHVGGSGPEADQLRGNAHDGDGGPTMDQPSEDAHDGAGGPTMDQPDTNAHDGVSSHAERTRRPTRPAVDGEEATRQRAAHEATRDAEARAMRAADAAAQASLDEAALRRTP